MPERVDGPERVERFPNTDRPIIVAGCARSGTTMLQLMLHAHRRLAVGPETRFVLDAYRRRREFGDLRNADQRRDLAHWIVDRPQSRFEDLGLDRADVVQRIIAAPPTLGSALAAVFQAYAARFGKARWGDKRPAYLQNLDVVLRLFPEAQVVNIVRDGRDCVASLKEMSWHSQDIHATVAAWARAVDDGRRAARRLGPQRYHEVRYEDLVADPHRRLAELCGFLREPYDPAMANPAAVAGVAVPAHKTWHERTRSAVTTQRIQSWRHRLTTAEIALCEAALGDRLISHGYELSQASRPPRRDLLRYRLTAAPHRLAPAKRGLTRAVDRLLPGAAVAARRPRAGVVVTARRTPDPVAGPTEAAYDHALER